MSTATPPDLVLTHAGCHLEAVTVRYPGADRPALDEVTLTVEPGDVLAVVGPSGSGKSTLLRVIAGLQRPDSGRVVVASADVTAVAPERRRVAMLFQSYALFPHLNVLDNIAFGMRIRRVPVAARRARAGEAAQALGLADKLDRLPKELSGGERQRVALARAVVRDPEVFCLDEPLSSLDAQLRQSARADLDPVLRAEGRCAIYVTHDQVEAMTIGDRVAVLRDGRLEQVGTPKAIYDDPDTEFVASFIGTPSMSLIAADTGLLPTPTGLPHSPARLGVRPEHLVVTAGGAGSVVAVDELGHERLLTIANGDQVVVARTAPDDTTALGAAVTVTAPVGRVLAFDASGRRLRPQ